MSTQDPQTLRLSPFSLRLMHGDFPRLDRLLERVTVRAVVLRGDELLLVHSRVNGDFMFPGGGVEPGESHGEALARELREECGAELLTQGALLGETREYRNAREPDYDAYCIRSLYYLCQVAEGRSQPRLQAYEQRLGFSADWHAMEEALHNNQWLLGGRCPQWTHRETRVLAQLHRWHREGLLGPL
ncbi:NUDIX hydrolase [Aeromonas sobria]|uniref:NUDIX hydrolase n=1 Tax=Aeromonas sobria TaxID=646 RepID=UPI003CFFF803